MDWIWLLLLGFGSGVYGIMVGAGGGFLIVPALVVLGGMQMHKAIGTSLFVISLKSMAEQLNPNKYANSIDLAALFCSYAKKRIENAFRGIWNNHDRSCYRLAQNVNNGEYAWLEDGGSDIEFK